MASRAWHHRFGRAGEDRAEAILTEAGYRIVQRRYRRRGGEIDLVATDRSFLVFVEVKTRRSATHGTAAQAVNRRKQRRLTRAARHYLREFGHGGRVVRFDVIALTGNGSGKLEAEWIEDAFRV